MNISDLDYQQIFPKKGKIKGGIALAEGIDTRTNAQNQLFASSFYSARASAIGPKIKEMATGFANTLILADGASFSNSSSTSTSESGEVSPF
jgi:hypothetical protein